MQSGLKEIPELKPDPCKRGRKKQHPANNLHDRFSNFSKETLRIMYDHEVAFANNQAERDIRMVTVKKKNSGCFRSQSGADRFCRIRSVISTSRKQNINILDTLLNAA